ncbi:MAG: hypothetical protein AMXMBFR84_08720 [Candidatus Hydrogenedentota bacterium]
MAIDPMKKVTVLCPVHLADALNEAIHDLGVVELVDASSTVGADETPLQKKEKSAADSDVQINKIGLILSLINEFSPENKSFFEGLTPLPLIIEPAELEHVRNRFDVEPLFEKARALDEENKGAQRRKNEIHAQIESLAVFEDVSFSVSDLRKPVHTRLLFGSVPTRTLPTLCTREGVGDILAWEIVAPGPALRKDLPANGGERAREMATKGERTQIVVACLVENEDAVRRALAAEQFKEIALPDIHGTVRDRIRELTGDLAESEEQISAARTGILGLVEHRRNLQILQAYWQDRRKQLQGASLAAEGRWVRVVSGYIRERDLPRLQAGLQSQLPECELIVDRPGPSDHVPVSITLPPLVRPVRMLVNLFGLPSYTAFDPSPFIIFTFLIFFGICFGDVGYGLMLTTLGGYLAYKTRAYEGVNGFARLLFLGGISTTIFGFLLGSMLGDIYDPKYLGEGNFLLTIKESTMVLDPLKNPVGMLLVALTIGVVNQFYGIGLKMYGAAKNNDWTTAICDGLLWLIALPGMIIIVSTMFTTLPPALFNTGLLLFAVGAVGLVLTQGRDVPGVAGKIGTGVVSLYGIVGSYGCTAFIGDVLSYCRLLALALTTSIVALTVNMIADLVRDIPAVGPVLFVVVLVFGHVFNFAISLLGAFVHAMRLIFVEFFGRFYDGGAKPFSPFGFDSPSYVLKRPAN